MQQIRLPYKLLFMRKLTIALLLLPLTLFAQTGETAKTYRNEIGLNAGILLLPAEDITQVHPALGLRYLRSYGNIQLGVAISANNFYALSSFGPNTRPNTSLSPQLIFNRTFSSEKYYTYIGATAGYYYAYNNTQTGILAHEHGYILGAQVGITRHLGKHFSLNGELALKSAQVWYKDTYIPANGQENIPIGTFNRFYFYTPVTIGIRYRF